MKISNGGPYGFFIEWQELYIDRPGALGESNPTPYSLYLGLDWNSYACLSNHMKDNYGILYGNDVRKTFVTLLSTG